MLLYVCRVNSDKLKIKIMTKSQLLNKGNVISSMVIGNSRDRVFKLEGVKYELSEDLSNGNYQIIKL
jgi:hypothetical protein